MRVAVGQLAPVADVQANLARIESLAAASERREAELLVLPEESMFSAGTGGALLAEVAEPIDGPFTENLASIAAKRSLAIIAGMYEANGGQPPYNTLVAVDARGELIGSYRKMHLYDAFDYRESDTVTPGDGLPVSIELAGLRIGLLNCYDVRFPELARVLAEQGCHVLATSAAWVRGPRKKAHWRTLLRARAIENTVWVAAAGALGESYLGHSLVVTPSGDVVFELGGRTQGIDVTEVRACDVSEARRSLPSLANRRITVSARGLPGGRT